MGTFDFSSFSGVFTWVVAHGYPFIYLAMCIEGPTVTAAATFATTLGYFNIWIIFALSLLGDIVPDMLFYVIGYWGRIGVVKRFGHYFGLTQARIERMEKQIKEHGGKTVAILKYTPVVAMPGLILVGAMRMKFGKFLFFVVAVTLQKTILFMAIGYFFGQAYNVGKYIKYGALVPFAIIFLYFIFVFSYKKISERIVKKYGKI
jgi:membrane protein DedA with SNARE-associated domain